MLLSFLMLSGGLLSVGLMPMGAYAASSGATIDLSDTETLSGTGWTYDSVNNAFMIENGANVTITGDGTTNRVKVIANGLSNVSITLQNAQIYPQGFNISALSLKGSTASINVSGTNTLEGDSNYGNAIDGSESANITINGSGTLNLRTSMLGAALNFGGSSGSLSILGGTINVSGGIYADVSGEGTLSISGGTFNARQLECKGGIVVNGGIVNIPHIQAESSTATFNGGTVNADVIYANGGVSIDSDNATVHANSIRGEGSVTYERPSAPTGVTAVSDNPGGISVSWTPPTNGGEIPGEAFSDFNAGTIEGYEYAATKSGDDDVWKAIASPATDEDTGTLSYSITGLTEGANYTVKVRARNEYVSSEAAEYGEEVTVMKTTPVLANTSSKRISATAANLYFNPNVKGDLYYAVVAAGTTPAPVINTSSSETYDKSVAVSFVGSVLLTTAVITSGAKDIYFLIKGENGLVSAQYKLYIPDFKDASVTPEDFTFDLYEESEDHKDLVVEFDPGSYTLESITMDGHEISIPAEISNKPVEVTILTAEELSEYPVGGYFVTFDMDGGTDPEMFVSVVDTTPIPYSWKDGDSTHTIGSDENLELTVETSLGMADDMIFIDGQPIYQNGDFDGEVFVIDDSDYSITVGETTTIVTLKSKLLNKLGAGKHTIRINFTDDKSVSAEFTVKTASSGSTPSTGDENDTPFALLINLMLTSAFAIFISVKLIAERKKAKANS